MRNAADFDSRRVQPLVASCRLAAATLHRCACAPAPPRPRRRRQTQQAGTDESGRGEERTARLPNRIRKRPRYLCAAEVAAARGSGPDTGRAGALCADDDPRDAVFGYRAAITFVACVRSLKLEATGYGDYQRRYAKPKLIRSRSRSAATTDHGRSCIVVVAAIRNSFGLSISSSRRGPRAARRRRAASSGASGSRASRGATSPCGTLFFVERSLTCLR